MCYKDAIENTASTTIPDVTPEELTTTTSTSTSRTSTSKTTVLTAVSTKSTVVSSSMELHMHICIQHV